jgi:hypothetical protein
MQANRPGSAFLFGSIPPPQHRDTSCWFCSRSTKDATPVITLGPGFLCCYLDWNIMKCPFLTAPSKIASRPSGQVPTEPGPMLRSLSALSSRLRSRERLRRSSRRVMQYRQSAIHIDIAVMITPTTAAMASTDHAIYIYCVNSW